MPYLESVPPPASIAPETTSERAPALGAAPEPAPEQPKPAHAEPAPAEQPLPAAQPRTGFATDLDLFVGFVGGSLVGLTILELGFFRTLVIGGCGALGVLLVRRHHEVMAKLRKLL
jgi:hypothetical protein